MKIHSSCDAYQCEHYWQLIQSLFIEHLVLAYLRFSLRLSLAIESCEQPSFLWMPLEDFAPLDYKHSQSDYYWDSSLHPLRIAASLCIRKYLLPQIEPFVESNFLPISWFEHEQSLEVVVEMIEISNLCLYRIFATRGSKLSSHDYAYFLRRYFRWFLSWINIWFLVGKEVQGL